MGARNAVLVALTVVGAVPAVGQAKPATGDLAPRIRAGDNPCRFTAANPQNGQGTDAPEAEPVKLPPGRYRVQVTCTFDGTPVTAPAVTVTVKAGRAARPSITVKPARLRIMATRGGERVSARVEVFPQSKGPKTTPVAEGNANAKFLVAEGRYDLRITKTSEPAGAYGWLRGIRVRGPGVTERRFDLADGKVLIGVKLNGKKAGASIRLYSEDGEDEVGEAEPYRAFALPPGRYQAKVSLLESADVSLRVLRFEIAPKKTSKHTVDFTLGTMKVTVRGDRAPLAAQVYVLVPGAQEPFTHFDAPGEVSIRPGTYEVRIEPRKKLPFPAPRRGEVEIRARRTTRVAFDITQATLQARLRKNGRSVVANDIRVVRAGSDEEVGRALPDGRFRLWPGRYEIVAELASGEEVRDGPFEVELGQTVSRTLEITRGVLTVDAFRGTAVAGEAMVNVYRPGAKVPLTTARAGAKIELRPGTFDVKVVAKHEWRWHEGVRIKDGKTTRLEVRFRPRTEAKLPDGEQDPLNDELPEGDAE